MVSSDRLFAASIPEVYDGLLVPVIFDAYGPVIAAQAASSSRAPYWRLRLEPELSREPWWRNLPPAPASLPPISISQ